MVYGTKKSFFCAPDVLVKNVVYDMNYSMEWRSTPRFIFIYYELPNGVKVHSEVYFYFLSKCQHFGGQGFPPLERGQLLENLSTRLTHDHRGPIWRKGSTKTNVSPARYGLLPHDKSMKTNKILQWKPRKSAWNNCKNQWKSPRNQWKSAKSAKIRENPRNPRF